MIARFAFVIYVIGAALSGVCGLIALGLTAACFLAADWRVPAVGLALTLAVGWIPAVLGRLFFWVLVGSPEDMARRDLRKIAPALFEGR